MQPEVISAFAPIDASAPQTYFNWFAIFVNVELSLLPTVLTAAMITTAMPAAIKPYSIAVAPELVFQECDNF